MKSSTYTLLLVFASTLALGFVNPTGAMAAPKGPGFEPMVEHINYTEGDQIPVGHTRVEVPRRYAEEVEKGLEAMPSYAGKGRHPHLLLSRWIHSWANKTRR